MAPLCKTWCNYTQLLELSFSSPHPLLFSFIYPIPPPSPLYSLLSVSLYSSEKILCRRFYCRKPTYPFFSLSLSLSLSRLSLRLFTRRCRIHPVFSLHPRLFILEIFRRSVPVDQKLNPRPSSSLQCDPFNGITRLRRSKLFTTLLADQRRRDLMQHARFMTS